MNNLYKNFLLIMCTASLAGCMVGPDFEKPQAENLPEAYTDYSKKDDAKSQAKVKEVSDEELSNWWKTFNDPVLDSLIERAFKNNFDLALAVSKVKQARSSLGIIQSGIFPMLNARAGASEGGTFDVSGDSYSVGLNAGWEIDVFGGTRRAIESSVANYKATLADKCASKVLVSAEVARNYFIYRAYQQELIITKTNLETQKRTYKITLEQKSSGFVSSLDSIRAAAQVNNTSSQLPTIEKQIALTRHTLEYLLGLQTGSLKEELAEPKKLPELENFIPLGVPAKLIQRRPDIISAEYSLHAAVAKIGEAQADWYPKFSITGEIGYAAPKFGSLFDNQFGTWSVGPAVSWNIFQAGKTYFNAKLQKELTNAAGISWDAVVLNAIKEVEDSLVSASKEREKILEINKLVVNSNKAFEVSTMLYEAGEIEFLDLLEAQRSLLGSQQQQIVCRQAFISNIISLYNALGGGWSENDLKDDEAEDSEFLFFLDSDDESKDS